MIVLRSSPFSVASSFIALGVLLSIGSALAREARAASSPHAPSLSSRASAGRGPGGGRAELSSLGGHGEAMYLPLRTFERVIEAAPRHLIGFIFAEMESVDEHMQQVVKEIFALRDELLSIPDLFLGMKSPPDPGYIAHGVNGHNYNFDASRIVPMGRIRSVSKVVTV